MIMKTVDLNELEDSQRAVVKLYRGIMCPECSKLKLATEVMTFGLYSPNDAVDASEVFWWCSCGHKWIEEPKEGETIDLPVLT